MLHENELRRPLQHWKPLIVILAVIYIRVMPPEELKYSLSYIYCIYFLILIIFQNSDSQN